jgi:hypothetical protein
MDLMVCAVSLRCKDNHKKTVLPYIIGVGVRSRFRHQHHRQPEVMADGIDT